MWMWQEPEPEYDDNDDYDPFAIGEDAAPKEKDDEDDEDDESEEEEDVPERYAPDEVDVLYDDDGNEVAAEDTDLDAAAEDVEETEVDIEAQDDPIAQEDKEPEVPAEAPRKKLKRELRAEALARLESAARTEADFTKVTEWWDRLDQNRERKERYHEVSRGDVPLEYKATYDGLIFPLHLNNPMKKQAQRGDFIEWLFDCAFEMDELVYPPFSRFIQRLSDEHKEILFFHYLHRYSTVELGAMRGQSDRNVRKVRTTMMKHLRRDFHRWMKRQIELGRQSQLPKEYIRFMERYDEG